MSARAILRTWAHALGGVVVGGQVLRPGTAYAWFVWDRAHSGPLVLDRISWVPAPVNE